MDRWRRRAFSDIASRLSEELPSHGADFAPKMRPIARMVLDDAYGLYSYCYLLEQPEGADCVRVEPMMSSWQPRGPIRWPIHRFHGFGAVCGAPRVECRTVAPARWGRNRPNCT